MLTCGFPSLAQAGRGAPQSWQGSEYLGQNKKRIAEACHSLACTQEQTRLAIAVAMGESTECCAKQRDTSKDNTPSANYSCFNLNEDMLTLVGWQRGGVDLNDNNNVMHAIAYIIVATHQWGIDGFLNFHRGGRTAWQDQTSYGAPDYRECIHAVMDYLAANPNQLTDNSRVGFDIPHV